MNCESILREVHNLLQHFIANKDDQRLSRNPYHGCDARSSGAIAGVRINLSDKPIILRTADLEVSCASLTIYSSDQHPTVLFFDQGGRISCSMKISGIAELLAEL